MKNQTKYKHSIIATIYLWIGFVCAISFMEAWLKFQAEGVTREIGLSIGSLVFSALNKVEITFGILLLLCGYRMRTVLDRKLLIFLLIPMSILLLQTLYLLPVLVERAAHIIQGETVVNSQVHFFYVALELVKVIVLLLSGRQAFRTV